MPFKKGHQIPANCHKIKGRSHNQSMIIECIHLLEFVEAKIKFYTYIDAAGIVRESNRISIINQAAMALWLPRIREKLKEVLRISQESKRYRKHI